MNKLEWLDALGLGRTKPPQLPERVPNESGQLKRHKDAVPELPEHAPAQKNGVRAENGIPSSLEGVERETNSAAEDIQTAWAHGFLTCRQLLLQAGLLVIQPSRRGRIAGAASTSPWQQSIMKVPAASSSGVANAAPPPTGDRTEWRAHYHFPTGMRRL